MAGKDYYKILGVSKDADLKGIRDAFRKLAKKYHPDKAGPEGKDRFQDVQEAYEILSDPDKRSSYDRQLRHEETGFKFSHRTPPVYDSGLAHSRSPFNSWESKPFRSYMSSRVHPDLILVLSQQEAQKGGIVEAVVPVYGQCPQCGGSGEQWFFPCMMCLGEGLVRERKRIRLTIPSGVEDGSIIEVPIQTVGALTHFLNVLIEVR